MNEFANLCLGIGLFFIGTILGLIDIYYPMNLDFFTVILFIGIILIIFNVEGESR